MLSVFNLHFFTSNSQFSMSQQPPERLSDKPLNPTSSTKPNTPRFLRAVGLFGLIAIAVNGVIGSGIFVLPATVASLLGAASPVAYIVAAFLIALIVLCFAEAGSMFEQTGGPYLYA